MILYHIKTLLMEIKPQHKKCKRPAVYLPTFFWCHADKIITTAFLIHVVIKTPTVSPSHGRYNVTQEKLMLFVFERQKLSFQLAVLMYSMSSKCKMHVVLCICVCMWLGMQLVSIKAVSLLSLSPFLYLFDCLGMREGFNYIFFY